MEKLIQLFVAMMAQIEAADDDPEFGFYFIDCWARTVKAYCDPRRKPELWERCRLLLLMFQKCLSESVRRKNPDDHTWLFIGGVKNPSLDTITVLADWFLKAGSPRNLPQGLDERLAEEESPARCAAILGIRNALLGYPRHGVETPPTMASNMELEAIDLDTGSDRPD